MARPRTRTIDLEAVWQELEKTHGLPPRELARRFNVKTDSLMLQLENNGYLLSEDGYGWIYPWMKVEEEHGTTVTG